MDSIIIINYLRIWQIFKMLIKNKKAVQYNSPIMLIFYAIIIIIILYGILSISSAFFNIFNLQKAEIDYFLILIIWVLLQITIVYGIYKLGSLAVKYFNIYKKNIGKWVLKINNNIITHKT